MRAKYIVVEFSKAAGETMIIFPKEIVHEDIAYEMGHNRTVISAGFILIRDGDFICHDESISLDVKSRPGKDSELANKMFGRI